MIQETSLGHGVLYKCSKCGIYSTIPYHPLPAASNLSSLTVECSRATMVLAETDTKLAQTCYVCRGEVRSTDYWKVYVGDVTGGVLICGVQCLYKLRVDTGKDAFN